MRVDSGPPAPALHRAPHAAAGAGFVAFVLKLRKGYYLYQFGQYAWTHLILLFVFVPSSFFVANIFDGIIWFLLPCSLVIINDIGAYLAGAPAAQQPGQLRGRPMTASLPAVHKPAGLQAARASTHATSAESGCAARHCQGRPLP